MSITYAGDARQINRRLTMSKTGFTGTRGYLFTTDAVCSEYDILNHPECPRFGSPHPDNDSCWVSNIDVENHEPYAGWLVTVSYSSEVEFNENPLDEPARITWDTEQFQKPLVKDKDGNAAVNSAGDPLDPPQMVDDSRRVVTIVKNLPAVPGWIQSYQDAVNSDEFVVDGVTVAVGKAKAQRVSVSEWNVRNDIRYRTLTLQLHLQKAGWKQEPLDQGFRIKWTIGGETKRQLITMENEDGEIEYPVAPVPLHDGAVIIDPQIDNVDFLSFRGYDEMPFADLPLT